MTLPTEYETRKNEHITLAVGTETSAQNQFADLAFVHHSLAAIDRDEVSLQTSFAGINCANPVYINAMTGGSDRAERLNGELAAIARDLCLPIATGSMSAFLSDPRCAGSYTALRRNNPHGIVVANVNANTGPAEARRAIELIGADAVQIHLNSVQEIVMPEGDRDFRRWLDMIAAVVQGVSVPVIVKDVGFGMSRETFLTLRDSGVAAVDVAGRGGTNFAVIENLRRGQQDFGYLSSWGQSAAESLLDIDHVRGADDPSVLASGGVRNPLDVVKSLALGADAVGVAGHFLRILVNDGPSTLAEVVHAWIDQITSLMTVLGTASVASLSDTDVVIIGDLAERCARRGIELTKYAQRSTRIRGSI